MPLWVWKIRDRKRRHKSRRRSPPPSTHTQPGCGAFSMSSLMSRRPPPASRCRQPLLSTLRGHPLGPHPPSRRLQRCGRGSQTGAHAASTKAHASARPGANNKAKARRVNSGQGPPTPLHRRRVKHQNEAGSSPSGSARRITPQPQRGTARPTTGGAQSSQSDAARGPTTPPRPVIGHRQGPPSRRARG